ncbi:MAG: hypothetical protein HS117_19450 [Verrucomicrobiaceae bacterium]|nr:hypothetical protein [Verrucomicrobiaceae bacterium]
MEKPVITDLAANLAIHNAGAEAERLASQQGMGRDEARSILDGAAGLVIAGKTFKALHPAFLLLSPEVDELAKQEPLLYSGGVSKAVAAFLLYDPRAAKALIDAGDAQAFRRAVLDFTLDFTTDDFARLNKWLEAEYKRLAGDDAGNA